MGLAPSSSAWGRSGGQRLGSQGGYCVIHSPCLGGTSVIGEGLCSACAAGSCACSDVVDRAGIAAS